MGMQLKAGTRLRSATDACEVVVVRTPVPSPSTCAAGDTPWWPIDAEVTPQSTEAGFDQGTQLGKRYADEELGLEVLCTKAGRRLALGGRDPARRQGRQTAARLGLSAPAPREVPAP